MGYKGYYRRTRDKRGYHAKAGSSCRRPARFRAIIAEKPKAAEKIAAALGNGVKCRINGVPYWIIPLDGEIAVVAPSAGHLFGPYTRTRGIPVLDIVWEAIWEFDRKSGYLRKFYNVLERVVPGAIDYVNACDYDIEGSVIGYMIIERLGDPRRAYRMKFSSLSPVDLRRAYQRLEPLDWEMIEAGRARHEMDFLWGINISRALMQAYRRVTGERIILSAGRVQSPTLVEAKNRWVERNLHLPLPTVKLSAKLEYDGVEFKAVPLGWRPRTLPEARQVKREVESAGYMVSKSITTEKKNVRAPPAFNLGDLQAEASRLYGMSPARSQALAEDLYLEGLISYPRTNSQKLPPTIDYKRIITSLSKGPLGDLAASLLDETRGLLKPVQGRKDDPAHPAIHPTGEQPKNLDREHRLIYELVVRRFLAAFARDAVVSRTRLELIDPEGRRWEATGTTVEYEGWIRYYPYSKPSESFLPRVRAGSRVIVKGVSVGTEIPSYSKKLSRISLLKWMESVGIGTEGTRSRIIEILYKRGYLKQAGSSSTLTELGYTVATIIEQVFPDLATPDMTRRFEAMIEDIRRGRRSREEVVEESRKAVLDVLEGYEARIREIGERLAAAVGRETMARAKCTLCGRPAVDCGGYTLCEGHCEALNRLQKSLPEIAEVLGVDERRALEKVASSRSVGQWVRDVASLLLKGQS